MNTCTYMKIIILFKNNLTHFAVCTIRCLEILYLHESYCAYIGLVQRKTLQSPVQICSQWSVTTIYQIESQSYISQVLKILKRILYFCWFWAGWTVRAVLKISAILLQYAAFNIVFFHIFMGKTKFRTLLCHTENSFGQNMQTKIISFARASIFFIVYLGYTILSKAQTCMPSAMYSAAFFSYGCIQRYLLFLHFFSIYLPNVKGKLLRIKKKAGWQLPF